MPLQLYKNYKSDRYDFETVDSDIDQFQISPQLVSDFKNPHEYANYAGYSLLFRSAKLRNKIKRAIKQHRPFVLDVVGIGAGLNNSQTFAALQQAEPDLKVLILEANNTTSVFDELNDAFRVNSIENPVQAGNDEYMTANFFSGTPVQVRDYNVNNEMYVSSQVFADTIKTAFYYSQTPIVFSQRVVDVQEKSAIDSWPARYKIITLDGLFVYANHVIAGTGLGDPRTVIGDNPTQALIKQQEILSAQADAHNDYNHIPGIETVDHFLKRIANLVAQGADPIEQGTVLVIGGKDGGNIAIEALTGLTEALNPNKRTGAQIIWLGQNRNKQDFVKQFLDNPNETWSPAKRNEVRYNRYAAICGLFDSGKIKTMAGHLDRIEQAQEFNSSGKPVTRYRVTAAGQIVTVDRVILAVGYDNKVDSVFNNFSDDGSERVFANTSDYTANQMQRGDFPIARRYLRQSLWVVGPACEQWKEKIFETQHWTLTDGGGAVDIFGTRSAVVGKYIARRIVSPITGRKFSPIQLTPEVDGEFGIKLNIVNSFVEIPSNGHINVTQIDNKIKTTRFLNQFRILSDNEVTLELCFSKSELTIRGLHATSAKTLAKKLAEDRILSHSIATMMQYSGHLYICVNTRKEDGSFRVENIEQQIEPAKINNKLSNCRL